MQEPRDFAEAMLVSRESHRGSRGARLAWRPLEVEARVRYRLIALVRDVDGHAEAGRYLPDDARLVAVLHDERRRTLGEQLFVALDRDVVPPRSHRAEPDGAARLDGREHRRHGRYGGVGGPLGRV